MNTSFICKWHGWETKKDSCAHVLKKCQLFDAGCRRYCKLCSASNCWLQHESRWFFFYCPWWAIPVEIRIYKPLLLLLCVICTARTCINKWYVHVCVDRMFVFSFLQILRGDTWCNWSWQLKAPQLTRETRLWLRQSWTRWLSPCLSAHCDKSLNSLPFTVRCNGWSDSPCHFSCLLCRFKGGWKRKAHRKMSNWAGGAFQRRRQNRSLQKNSKSVCNQFSTHYFSRCWSFSIF